jgi:hypothetical protein
MRLPRAPELPNLPRVSCLDAGIALPAIFTPEQFLRGPSDDYLVPLAEYRPVETRWTVCVFVSWAGGMQPAPGVRQRWLRRPRVTARTDPVVRAGGLQSASRVPAAMPPDAAGTERACRSGVSVARSHANSEGPHRGTPLLGRSRRSLGAPRAGASKRQEAAHPRGKTKAVTRWKRLVERPPRAFSRPPRSWGRTAPGSRRARGIPSRRGA